MFMFSVCLVDQRMEMSICLLAEDVDKEIETKLTSTVNKFGLFFSSNYITNDFSLMNNGQLFAVTN
jgi:hypothetical protein